MADDALRHARSMLNKLACDTFALHTAAFRALLDQADGDYDPLIDLIGHHAVSARGPFVKLFADFIKGLTDDVPAFRDAVAARIGYELRIGLESADDNKDEFLGMVDLVSHLGRNEAIAPDMLRSFIDSAFGQDSPVAVEAVYRVLLVMQASHAKLFAPAFDQLARSCTSRYPNRLRFLILDLLELRDRGWIPRRQPDLPTMMPIQQFRQCVLRQTNG